MLKDNDSFRTHYLSFYDFNSVKCMHNIESPHQIYYTIFYLLFHNLTRVQKKKKGKQKRGENEQAYMRHKIPNFLDSLVPTTNKNNREKSKNRNKIRQMTTPKVKVIQEMERHVPTL
jgi:hypothetical protein